MIAAGSSFADRVNTNVYMKKSLGIETVPGAALANIRETSGLNQISGLSQKLLPGAMAGKSISDQISHSWLKDDSPWKTALDKLTSVGLSVITDDSPLIRLINAESETGRLLGLTKVNTSVTSVAAQMASIFKAEGLQNVSGISSLLSGYSDFALSQHKQIQKALEDGRNRNAEWRLGLLDTTAKFVDRQITWGNNVVDGICSATTDAEEIDLETSEQDENIEAQQLEIEAEDSISVFTILPRDLGYSNREDSAVTVETAFCRSKFLTITESGKSITDGIVAINRYRQDLGLENVFSYTNKNVGFMLDIGNNICESEHTFGDMIDHLYFLFYENLEHIKEFIGKGDKKLGDTKVRDEDIYQCIFRVKDIRSDLRHDLEHGSEKEVKKKKERTSAAYKHYASKRPRTPKEYKSFQVMIYKEFAELLAHICEEVTGDK